MDEKKFEQTGERAKTFKDYKGMFWLIFACLAILAIIWYFPQIADTLNYYLGYLRSVICGILLAFMLNPVVVPLQARFTKKFLKSKKERVRKAAERKARHYAIAIAVTIGLFTVVLISMLIIPELLNSVIKLGQDAPSLLQKATEKLDQWYSDRSWAGSLQKYVDVMLNQAEIWLTETLLPSATKAFTMITSAAWSVVRFILDFLIGFIIAVYVLNEKKSFIKWSKKIVFASFKPETANLIIDTGRVGNRIFGKYMLGSVIDSLVVGVICFIFNVIAGIPYALLVAALVGVTNIIPFFGPFLGAIPSTIIILIIDPVKAMIFVIFIIILQQIEGNIIAPRILGNVTGVSEFWVTFALLFFGAMFGIIGMVLGVPLLAVIAYVMHRVVDKRAESKGLTTDTDYYLEVKAYDTENQQFEMIDHNKEEEQLLEERAKPRSRRTAEFFNRLFKKLKAVFFKHND